MCRQPSLEAQASRRPAGLPVTGLFSPQSSLTATEGLFCDSIGASTSPAVSEMCTERTAYYRQDSSTSCCSSMSCSSVFSPTAVRQQSPPSSGCCSSRQQQGCHAAGAGYLSHHAPVLPTWEIPEEHTRMPSRSQALLGMHSSNGMHMSSSMPLHTRPLQSDYEAWLAASGQLAPAAAAAPAASQMRRPHSLELPALDMRQASSGSSRASQRRYSYHHGPSNMPLSSSYGRPPTMPHSHTAPQFADEGLAAAAAYGSRPSRHGSGHFNAVLPSVPDGMPACNSSSSSRLPADYGCDEFLLDEQVQAMLVDVISHVGGELAAAAPASNAADLSLQQQRSMARRTGSLSRQASMDTPHSSRAAATPAAVPAPVGSGDAAADALAALNSYMQRHEQQKQRHQQCISAAAAAASLSSSPGSSNCGMPAGLAGLVGAAGAAGLSRQAQAKLQELMAAQQMQLEIQMELLQLLSAA
uniref:Uncharacterized protein n=1 Tax=Tetradesmus obliquus TaxID=3088 RepID=A0A383WMU6_TETOB|eukprot:jgi/Sobl393_1/15519/SZX78731.1